MRKNLIKLLLTLIIIAPCMFLFCACGSEKTEAAEKIIELSDDNVSLEYRSIAYSGDMNYPSIIINKDGEQYAQINCSNDDFELVYSNNQNAGRASVLISATKNNTIFSGEITKFFTINPISIQITQENKHDFVQIVNNKNYNPIVVCCDLTIGVNETLNISLNQTIKSQTSSNDVTITNNGKINNLGTILLGQENCSNDAKLFNYGTIENSSKIYINSRGTLYNYSAVQNQGKLHVESHGTIYSNSLIDDVTKDVFFGNYYVRTNRFTAQLQYSAVNYNKNAYTPTVEVFVGSSKINESEYDIVYQDNVNIGQAEVHIIAKQNSMKIYGEHVVYFTINAVPISVTKIGDLVSAMENENYLVINATNCLINQLTVRANCTLNLRGQTKIFNDKVLNKNGLLTNNGVVNNQGNLFIDGSINNLGSFSNTGKLYVSSSSQITGNIITNSGTAYADIAQPKFNGSVKVRQELQSTDFSLSADSFVYNAQSQTPSITFNNSNVGNGTYVVNFYDADNASVSAPKNVGSYKIEVEFLNSSETYYGKIIKTFTIEKGIKLVALRTEFLEGYDDPGYECIQIIRNITLSKTDLITIPEGKNIEINEGVQFLFNGTLTNNGTIINRGKLIYGYQVDALNNNITASIEGDGQITNYGEVYANESAPSNVDGVIKVRKNVKLITFEIPDIDYHYIGSTIRPTVSVQDEGTDIPSSNYSLNFDAWDVGKGKVLLNSKSDSEMIYGEDVIVFDVLPGTITVTTENELLLALQSRNSNGKSNWGKIIIGATFSYTKGNIRIDQDMVLDVQNYMLRLSYPTQIYNKGTVLIKNCNLGDLYINSSSTGKVKAYVSTLAEFNQVINFTQNPADIIYLEEDIISAVSIKVDRKDITIDLQGHVLGTSVVIEYITNTLIIQSTSESKGTVGDGTIKPAIEVEEIQEDASVRLNAIKYYGVSVVVDGDEDRIFYSDCELLY